MSTHDRLVAPLAAVCLLSATVCGAQEGSPAGQTALLRRLEEAEARIKTLEELVQGHSQQLAEQKRRLETVLARGEPTATPPEARGPAPQPQERRPPAAVEPPPERPVTHQLVSLTFNGLVQAWYAAGDRGLPDTFRIRRSEMYFNGEITKKARWQVMIDAAKALSLDTASTSIGGSEALTGVAVNQSSRILQNAVITFDYVPKLQISVGQFKLPLSLEGQQSSGRLDTVERALFASDRARGGTYGDVRDLGLLVRGGLGRRVDYQAGVFNEVAESQNDADRNDQKALAGSVVARPLKDLQVGGSGAWGNSSGVRPRRDRLGAELQFVRGPFTIRSELMTGHDGPVRRRGAYGHVGYRFVPTVEAVLRLDSWDPDTGSDSTAASVAERDYVAGVNVLLSRHNLKLQANYLRKTFRGDVIPSRNVLLLNTQTFW